ncbi:substrate-binding domain-containing protein [Rubrivivax rivuli]|uniref:ABC transporter substrate-binding protein n=1 Tax=Rubrivivax rivuli TaxID=1862385 RepID=A0A437RL77_9BURK|nr:substrate-binding domain-containing protein [Rubrivivax rivuli]RVU47550.1 ABC transporter substrate-binding protein [Rubrivivax rivuli]
MNTPASPLTGISSMATRHLLAELAERCVAQGGPRVVFESVGGVDAARRVAAGEHFDLVVLASDAIDTLLAAGQVRGPRLDLVRSAMVVAVPAGAPHPPLHDEAALRDAVAAAPSIGYSTGPSGKHLLALVARWGLQDSLAGRLVLAPPGVPVATLVASGQAAMGFQQLPEFAGQPGIEVVGELPAGAAQTTVFSAALGLQAAPAAVVALAHFMHPATAALKRHHGLSAAG